jgi:hypothetical protein
MDDQHGYTREQHTAHTRRLYEEAHATDSVFMDEVTARITGSPVFVWDRLTLAQTRAIGQAAYIAVLQARG